MSDEDEEGIKRDPVYVEQGVAILTARDYVCAGCWGRLEWEWDNGRSAAHVWCNSCGDGRGFVTKGWADRRRNESAGELHEVKAMMREIGMLPVFHRTPQEILRDLGF